MAKIKTTTTVEFTVDDFNRMIAEKLFPGKKIDVNFVIETVGGDALDTWIGHDKVTRVRITFEETPKKNVFWSSYEDTSDDRYSPHPLNNLDER
jgi:hypothetical protein